MTLHTHMPTDQIWRQYGEAIMTQYPEDEWERRISQVPPAYRAYIRERIWKESAATTANASAEATQQKVQ